MENIGSPSYANPPNIDTFHCTIQKQSHWSILPSISESALSMRKCQAHRGTSFPKF